MPGGQDEKPGDQEEESDGGASKKQQKKLRKVVHVTYENSAVGSAPALTRDEEITLQILLAEFRMVGLGTIMYDYAANFRLLQCNAFDRSNNSLCDSFLVKLTDVENMVGEATNIRRVVPKFPSMLKPTVTGTAWYNNCGAVRIRYPGRWCYPALQPKQGVPAPTMSTLHQFYMARLDRVHAGENIHDVMLEITNVFGDIFRDHLFGVRVETMQTSAVNLFLFYHIEDMVRHVMLGEGSEAGSSKDEGGTGGTGPANAEEKEDESTGKYREFLRKQNEEASGERRGSADGVLQTSGILAELCRESDKAIHSIQRPTLYAHGNRVDIQQVDPGLELLNEFKDPDRQSTSYNDFFLGFLHDMEEYARQDGKDLKTCLIHGDLRVDKVLIDNFDQVWLSNFSRMGIGPELNDLAQLECDLLFRCNFVNPEDEQQLEVAKTLLKRLCRSPTFGPVPLPSGTYLSKNLDLMWRSILAVRQQVARLVEEEEGVLEYHFALLAFSLQALADVASPAAQRLPLSAAVMYAESVMVKAGDELVEKKLGKSPALSPTHKGAGKQGANGADRQLQEQMPVSSYIYYGKKYLQSVYAQYSETRDSVGTGALTVRHLPIRVSFHMDSKMVYDHGDDDNDEEGADLHINDESDLEDEEDEGFAGLEMDASTVPVYMREMFNKMMIGVDFARHRSVCVEGEQGSGKSALLRWLMWAACKVQLERMDLLLGKSNKAVPDDDVETQLQEAAGNDEIKLVDRVDTEKRDKELKRLQQELKVREGRPDFYLPVVLPMHRVSHMMQKKKLWGGTDDILLHWLEEEHGAGTGVYRLLKELRKNRRLIVLVDGLEEVTMRKRDLMKYVVDTLIEDNLPLVVTTAQPTCLPPDLVEQSKVGQMLPLHQADQILAAQLLLGTGTGTTRVLSQMKDLLDRPQYAEICQNPYQLALVLNAVRSNHLSSATPTNHLQNKLYDAAVGNLLNPLGSPMSTRMQSVRQCMEWNKIEKFDWLEEESHAVSEQSALTLGEVGSFLYRVAYDTHQRREMTVTREDLEEVATEEQAESGLVSTIHRMGSIGRVPLLYPGGLNGGTGHMQFPHLALQQYLAMRFMEEEFEATIKHSESPEDLVETVQIVFTEENKRKYSALRDVWWYHVLIQSANAMSSGVYKSLISVLAKDEPVAMTDILTFCIYQGDRAAVAGLVQGGVVLSTEFNQPNLRDLQLPLHKACMAAVPSMKFIKVLLDVNPAAARLADRDGNLPLHYACSVAAPNRALVEALLSTYRQGAREIDNKGRYPFHYIAMSGCPSLALVDMMYRAYLDCPTMTDNKGLLPIHYACQSSQLSVEFLRELIELHVQGVSASDEQTGRLPLHFLCATPVVNVDLLEMLVDAYPEGLALKDKNEDLAIDLVLGKCTNLSVQIVELLLDTGEPLDQKALIMRTFKFLLTASKPTKAVAEALLNHIPAVQHVVLDYLGTLNDTELVRPDITVQIFKSLPPGTVAMVDKFGKGAAHWACQSDNPSASTVQAMISIDKQGVTRVDEEGMLPLHWACKAKKPSEGATKALLRAFPKGAEKVDKYGCLPLHYMVKNPAATEGMVRLLIDVFNGACADYDGTSGLLPLHTACSVEREVNRSWVRATQHLLRAYSGAAEEACRKHGMLALHYCCKNRKPSYALVVMLLEAYPAACCLPDEKWGNMPLHWAVRAKKPAEKIIRVLIKSYPDACRDYDSNAGRLPLHFACESNNSSISLFSAVLKAYPDAVAMGDELAGRLPVHWACKNPNSSLGLELVKKLIKLYPEALKQTDQVGALPIHYACENRTPSEEVVRILLRADEFAGMLPDKHNGFVALELACRNSRFHEGVVRILLEANPELALRGMEAAQAVGHVQAFFLIKSMAEQIQQEKRAVMDQLQEMKRKGATSSKSKDGNDSASRTPLLRRSVKQKKRR